MRSSPLFPLRSRSVIIGFGAVSEAILFLCLLPAILILAMMGRRYSPRPMQRLLEDRKHRA
jgi:hypothetical protein